MTPEDYTAETCEVCGLPIGYMTPAESNGDGARHKRCDE